MTHRYFEKRTRWPLFFRYLLCCILSGVALSAWPREGAPVAPEKSPSPWTKDCMLISPEKYEFNTEITDPRQLPARQCAGVEDPKTLKNPVDRRVCADPALSNLAERLNRAYDRALSASNDPQTLAADQRRWQRRLERCLDDADAQAGLYCVWRRYEVRLYELTRNQPLPDCVTPAIKKSLARQPCPEAEFMPDETYKMGCLRRWIGDPENFALNNKEFHRMSASEQACQPLFEAFTSFSPEIEYIEPFVRTSEAMHPALARYRACFDTFDGAGFMENSYYVLQGDTGHGFRLYRLDLDGNPKTAPQEYIYSEEMGYTLFRVGYYRLGFPAGGTPRTPDDCQTFDFIPAAPQRLERLLPADSGVNAVIRFRGSYYIYDARTWAAGTRNLNLYRYDPVKKNFPILPYCRWTTFWE